MSQRIVRVVFPEEIERAREKWKRFPLNQVGTKLAELMGLPTKKTDLKAEIREKRLESDGIILEDVWFESEPGTPVPTYLCRRADLKNPAPAVLCLHGSGRDRNLLVEKEYWHEGAPQYRLHSWGRELARRGFITLCPTCHGYGERRERGETWGTNEFYMLLWGRSAQAWNVWDAIRCLDYLETRPEVDANRLGCTGFSMGGMATWMTMTVDRRIKAGAPVGGALGSYLGNPGGHSVYYYIPHILKFFDQPQMVASLAPRALLVVHSQNDRYVSPESVPQMEAYARPFYEKLGAGDRLKIYMPQGDHDLTPEILDRITEWFRRWL